MTEISSDHNLGLIQALRSEHKGSWSQEIDNATQLILPRCPGCLIIVTQHRCRLSSLSRNPSLDVVTRDRATGDAERGMLQISSHLRKLVSPLSCQRGG